MCRLSRRNSFGGESLHDRQTGQIVRGVAAVPSGNMTAGPESVALMPCPQGGNRDTEALGDRAGAQAVMDHPTAPLAWQDPIWTRAVPTAQSLQPAKARTSPDWR